MNLFKEYSRKRVIEEVSMMKWTKFISIPIFLILLMMPVTAYAVDFEISDVQIDVYLKEDGNVDVIEKHVYDFDSKFNGITRELYTKKDTSITNFEAYEKDQPLKIEKEENFYKVHRSGKKETVHFELRYTITDAVEKYEDGAQFYWSFFDDGNETTYENMTIVVHPPEKSVDTDFLGYDGAYKAGEMLTDGVVQFAMGKVPDGTNAGIRVIYESTLFPNVEMQKGEIRHELQADEEEIEEALAIFSEKQANTKVIGLYTFTGFALLIMSLVGYMITKKRGMKRLVSSVLENHIVPQEKMSMPATIYYTKLAGLDAEGISAALLDLIRKGYVKQVTEESYTLVDASEANEHEKVLINLLFHQIGEGNEFNLDDLEVYTKEEKNHKPYGESLAKWRNAVLKEVKAASLYEKKAPFRWIVGLLSVALLPVIIQLGRYEVYSFMALLIVLALGGLLIALLYYPRNVNGAQIKEEWSRFSKRFKDIETNEWESLPVDDKYRAYIYGIGVKDKSIQKICNKFEQAEKRSGTLDASYPIAYNPIFMTQTFTTANTNASVSFSGDTSTSSPSSGGGVGGSGGGSGAF